MWFAGIDWADHHHDVVLVNPAGESVGHLRVTYTVEGLEHLATFLRTAAQDPEQVLCVVETSSGLLVTRLLDTGFLVYPVHPTTAARLRPPSGVKTDTRDALLLARKGDTVIGQPFVSCALTAPSCKNSRR